MEIKNPFSGEPISSQDRLDALIALGRDVQLDRLDDLEALKSESDSYKIMHAAAMFHILARDMARMWNMKNHCIAFGLEAVLQYWERR